jgi:hypothetical protein
MGPIIKVWIQLSHDNDVDFMVKKLNPSCSRVEPSKICIRLRSLTIHRFGTVEATRLKKFRAEDVLNGTASLQNFVKMYH